MCNCPHHAPLQEMHRNVTETVQKKLNWTKSISRKTLHFQARIMSVLLFPPRLSYLVLNNNMPRFTQKNVLVLQTWHDLRPITHAAENIKIWHSFFHHQIYASTKSSCNVLSETRRVFI
jgi:hypothetical protein